MGAEAQALPALSEPSSPLMVIGPLSGQSEEPLRTRSGPRSYYEAEKAVLRSRDFGRRRIQRSRHREARKTVSND